MVRLRSLVTILFRPRDTIRGILSDGQSRRVVPLVLAAILSMILSDARSSGFREALSGPDAALKLLVIVLGVTVGAGILFGLFWLVSWACHLAARFLFGGTGSTADARAALAWGLAPEIWALLFRLPAALLGFGSGPELRIQNGGDWTFDPGRMSQGCGAALLFGLLELAIFVWCVVLSSINLAEAERISGGKAFGAIAVTLAAPVIIVIAALLAAVF